MMSSVEFVEHLSALRLSQTEASQLLGVSDRTLRRWAEGESVPGPVEAALRAWRSLDRRHLPWKPDSMSVLANDEDQMERMEAYDRDLAQVLKEVEARGGPANPWTVDLARDTASFGPAEVGFYRLRNGGFSPTTYRRQDRRPSVEDTPDIQDAVYWIADAFSKARGSNKALIAIADYVRKHAAMTARDGATLATPAEKARTTHHVAMIADELDALAVSALDGKARYAQFEAYLGQLHRQGFFPEMSLVSAVAQSMIGRPRIGAPQ